ncbi:IclR family transcriptional regulator [Azospirillum doebereinerae]
MSSATRILDVFEVFAEQRRPLTLSQLAEVLDAPVSSCFGLVSTLQQRGYLRPVGDRKELYPTRRMLQNAEIISKHEPVIERMTRSLEILRESTQETVILGELTMRPPSAVYLNVLEGPQSIRYSARIGDLKPLHSSSTGKALLAALPDDRRRALLGKTKLEPITANTLTSVDALEKDLEEGRRRGYQMTRGENVSDVAAVAMAVTVADRLFAVAVAGPAYRIAQSLRQHHEALKTTIEELRQID